MRENSLPDDGKTHKSEAAERQGQYVYNEDVVPLDVGLFSTRANTKMQSPNWQTKHKLGAWVNESRK